MTFFWLMVAFLAGGMLVGLLGYFRNNRASQPSNEVRKAQNATPSSKDILSALAHVHVDDVMIPRPRIQAIDLEDKPALLRQQIASYHHLHLPVYEGVLDEIIGVLDLRDALRLSAMPTLDADTLRALLRPAYYIPSGTPLLKQLEQFHLDKQRMGLVVDEYGELQGLVTQSDLAHEIAAALLPQKQAIAAATEALSQEGVVIDAGTPLRTLNRRIGSNFPLDGPKTLSGLIIENLGEIPEAGTQFILYDYCVSILQVKKHKIHVVKLRTINDEDTFSAASVTPSSLQMNRERASSNG